MRHIGRRPFASSLLALHGLCSACAPQALEPETRPASSVVAGQQHTCGVSPEGAVRCWGRGLDGRLGYGNEQNVGDDERPASVGDVDVGGPVSQLALGHAHTCALLVGGWVRCWGNGMFGRLGYGNEQDVGDDEPPATALDVDVGGAVVQIAAGGDRTCALLDNGNVRCWGDGLRGALGYGNEENVGDDEVPASVGDVNVGGRGVQLALGGGAACVVLDDGALRCWGTSHSELRSWVQYPGQISREVDIPAEVGDIDVGGKVAQVSLGERHGCALLQTGEVRCWGESMDGKLGYGNLNQVDAVVPPEGPGSVELGGRAVQISAGHLHTCAVLETGALRCWGAGVYGIVGIPRNVGDDELPASVPPVDTGGAVSQVSAGRLHTCALLTNGAIRCWGAGRYGVLGYGNERDIGDDEPLTAPGKVHF